MNDILYFVDGYHGGIEGHMPDGSFEDILDALERYPEWKISLEIEPESWNELKRKDYPIYRKLQEFVTSEKTKERIEFISGAYGQPFCWAINGESNIRQLKRGIAEIQKHFDGVVIDTYAVQEPCFTSALPQICLKLGYRRMSLKNPTSWGGYMSKMKGSLISLYSADGSSIPTVPRYDCEELVSCSATEGAGYDFKAINGFAEKCVKNGILHPLGMCLQDLGWRAHPMAYSSKTEYVTYREYFSRFGSETDGSVKFSQDDICCALPWGNLILQQMCRKVKTLENRILQIEKLLAFAEIRKHVMPELEKLLQEAWDMLLLVQHHDGYICATTGGSPYKSWANRADYLTLQGQKLLSKVEEGVLDLLQSETQEETDVRYIRVYNTQGERRNEIAALDIALPKGYHSIEITDSNGTILPVQIHVKRRYDDDSLDAIRAYFPASVTGIGYQTYCVKPVRQHMPVQKMLARCTVQDTVEVETSELFVVLDRTRGGSIVRLCDKRTGKEYVSAADCMGYLKGYLVEEDTFISTQNLLTELEVMENGALYTKIRFTATKNGIRFETIYEISEGIPRVDVTSKVNFSEKTYIGYPLKPKEGEEYYGRMRSGYREDYKLGIQIPLPMKEFKVIKHAPFENYVSKNIDTRFLGWHEIKHNIINDFLDFQDMQQEGGMAVFCDHITGYSLIDNSFSLTQAFGYYAGFWWGCQPLYGDSEMSYSILLHVRNFEEGEVASWNRRWKEPLIVQQLNGRPEKTEDSIFCVDDLSLEVVTIYPEKEKMMVRLFNHGMEKRALNYVADIPDFVGEKTDLNGILLDEADAGNANASEIITLR